MIKVVASDMDGTLLNGFHKLSPETLEAVRLLSEADIEFIIATGRTYDEAQEALEGCGLSCHYILASGAEIRNPKGRILKRIPMDYAAIREIYEIIKNYPLAISYCTNEYDYMIGTKEEVERAVLEEMRAFSLTGTDEEIRKSEVYQRFSAKILRIKSLDELLDRGIEIHKLFIFSNDISMLKQADQELAGVSGIVSASSMDTNLELTDIKAQKGPALLEYIAGLGYHKEEVMVIGDSLNDLSMFSGDFGASIAMANAFPAIKAAASHITKSNQEDGVGYAIRLMLKGRLDEIKK